MSLSTRSLHPTLACEVTGLALWEKPAAETVAALRQLWSRYGVLLFRRQALGEAEFAEFSAWFGPLERIVRTDWASPVVPESETRRQGRAPHRACVPIWEQAGCARGAPCGARCRRLRLHGSV